VHRSATQPSFARGAAPPPHTLSTPGSSSTGLARTPPPAAELTCASVVGLKQQKTTLQRTTTQRCLAQMRKTPPPFMITNIFALLVACIALPLISSTSAAASAPRVSVNVFDAWYNRLPGGHGRVVSLQHMTEACSASGFTVIRVATAPFWPVDAKLLSDDEQQVSTASCLCDATEACNRSTGR
jgi:hypothetical protein